MARTIKSIRKSIEKSQWQYQQILIGSLVLKGLNPSHAKLGAELIVEAGRHNDEMLNRSANTYRLILGMDAR